MNKNEIVLLDDNNDTNFYNEDVVEETNLFKTISVFESPVKLLEEISKRVNSNIAIPGFFIVDVKMPEMDGFEFLDELDDIIEHFEEYPKVFILTTSNHKRDHEQFSKSFMAKSFLVKPLSSSMLIDEINKLKE
jgi:response regulator RpfG family c-di-GMP phosphodiesterase